MSLTRKKMQAGRVLPRRALDYKTLPAVLHPVNSTGYPSGYRLGNPHFRPPRKPSGATLLFQGARVRPSLDLRRDSPPRPVLLEQDIHQVDQRVGLAEAGEPKILLQILVAPSTKCRMIPAAPAGMDGSNSCRASRCRKMLVVDQQDPVEHAVAHASGPRRVKVPPAPSPFSCGVAE